MDGSVNVWRVVSWFVGLVYVTNHGTLQLEDGEKIFMLLVNALFHPVIAGILLGDSGGDHEYSGLSVTGFDSSCLAEDFYKQVFKTDASSEEIVTE